MSVTAAMIKELRDRSGVGMSDCKKALVETDGDMDKAIEFLRKKGIAGAVKKEGRDAKEGVIAFAETDDVVALVEVSAETDFVTSNEVFQDFIANIAEEVAQTKPSDLESFLQQTSSKDSELTIDELRATTVQTVGENIQIRRFVLMPKDGNTSIGVYRHMGGKIVAAVEIQGSADLADFARDIAMHAAAAAPEFLDADSVPADVIEKEKEIAREQVKDKPENIQDKIIQGKLRAFFDQVCLANQGFIKDDSQSIAQLVQAKAKETGAELKLTDFKRWSVGA